MKAACWITAIALGWAIAGVTKCSAVLTGWDIATRPIEAEAVVQLAGEVPVSKPMSNDERRRFENDTDSDELPALPNTRMPGEKHSNDAARRSVTAGKSVTASPQGYDAKHLDRMWGRFTGLKTNSKEEKQHVPKASLGEQRTYRWH